MVNLLLPVVIGYLIGSIPFGVIVGKFAGVDIRKVGSGNIGATNIYRTLGTFPALMVFLLDMIKGTGAVHIAQFLLPSSTVILSREFFYVLSGIAAVIGHSYPVYIGFKGGKGSATGLGVLLGIAPDLFIIAMIYTAFAIAVTRYVSVTSITGVILLSVLMFSFHKPTEYLIASVIVAALVIYRHIPNIKRLMAGTEPKIWGKK
jgi:glycerol-3-phosphate acyltransferase PlsY